MAANLIPTFRSLRAVAANLISTFRSLRAMVANLIPTIRSLRAITANVIPTFRSSCGSVKDRKPAVLKFILMGSCRYFLETFRLEGHNLEYVPLQSSFKMSLSTFAKGEIIGRARHETKGEIAKSTKKSNGAPVTERQVFRILATADELRARSGERAVGSGAPRKISAAQQDKLVKLVFKERGSARVTVPHCKQKLPFLRTLSDTCVREALHNAGLLWLRRRRKVYMKPDYRRKRRAFARWIRRQLPPFMRAIAFIDGTTFYLARDEKEAIDQGRRRLGPYVWRMASCKDGLFSDNVGPSLYKCQGAPVKVWGLLANAHLRIEVLPMGDENGTTHMNGERYRSLVRRRFSEWIGSCFPVRRPRWINLVQDGEKCLWQPESVATLNEHNFCPLEMYPPSSPDLNPIENVWHRLRQILDDGAPVSLENRNDFISRLHGVVRSLNTTHRDELKAICTSMHDRGKDVLLHNGARTKW